MNDEERRAHHKAVMELLERLDGTLRTAVSVFSGIPPEKLDELGGVTEESAVGG